MKKYITGIIVVVLLAVNIFLLITILSDNDLKETFNRRGPERGGPGFAGMLDFNAAQMKAFNEKKEAHFEEVTRLTQKMNSLREEVSDEIRKEHIDSARIDQLVQALGRAHAELEAATFWHFREIRQICDGPQKQQFDSLTMRMMRIDPGRHHQNNRPGRRWRQGQNERGPRQMPDKN